MQDIIKWAKKAVEYWAKYHGDNVMAFDDTMDTLANAINNAEGFPEIVCLCGSTRFYQTFQEANYRETMAGNIVLSVGFYAHATEEMRHIHGESVGITPEQKEELDRLHFRKIELCDRVLILNCNGYIGESTRNELNYARKLGKIISFWEEVPND